MANRRLGLELDQLRRSEEVLAGDCTANRFRAVTVGFVPVARPQVQGRHELWRLVFQVQAKDIAKEMVIAVPLPPVIEGDQEEVGSLQDFEDGLAVALAGDGIAERRSQAVEDGGANQERPDVVRLPPKHLLYEVIDDVPVVAGERGDESG